MKVEFKCGHERTEENSRYKRAKNGRYYPGCRTCYNASEQRRKLERRANRPTRSNGARARSTMREREETFPVDPLLSHVRGRLLTKADERLVERARGAGQINVLDADKIAVALGTHPGLIWPEWWIDLEETA